MLTDHLVQIPGTCGGCFGPLPGHLPPQLFLLPRFYPPNFGTTLALFCGLFWGGGPFFCFFQSAGKNGGGMPSLVFGIFYPDFFWGTGDVRDIGNPHTPITY